jgi:HAD superfamily hydrolase (TIGR01509 family)
MDFKGVNTIIFDLGGVLLNIDYHLTINAFKELGFSDFDNTFSQFKQSNISDLYETGKVSSLDFYEAIIKNKEISFKEFTLAWNALLLDFPQKRFELLTKLGENFNLYLCSNTNELHYNAFQKIVNQYEEDFDSLFIKAYYSHQIALRKPNSSIFEFILGENKLVASEVLFIDDSIQHIETAKSLGLKTMHVKEKTVEEIFVDWLK